MTISNQSSAVTAEGNGVTTSWTFNFKIPTTASCVVTLYDTTVDPVTNETVTSSLYTVTGINNASGGTVNYPLSGSPLSSGQYLTISRILPLIQTTAIAQQSNFYPQAVENSLDYLTMITQQLDQQLVDLTADLENPPAPTVPDDFQMVTNIAELRGLTLGAGSLVYVKGHTTAGDGGGGYFLITTTNPGTDDNGFNVALNATGYYAVRQLTEDVIIPEFFGATGNGTTNDTTALQSCLSASCALGFAVILKQGSTYLVGPSATSSSMILSVTSGFVMHGNNATIKVKNSVGNYYGILGTTTTASLSKLSIYDTVFDHNISNNSLTTTASINSYPQFTVYARAGDNLRFERNTVKNMSNINSIVFNGNTDTGTSAINYISINDNLFLTVGDDPTHLVHDHSTIYAVGTFIEICRNRFVAASLGCPSARAAIETHGTVYTVAENQVWNYDIAMNITGVYDGGDSVQGIIGDNSSRTLYSGIRIFSTTYQTHTSGFGIDGLLIQGNSIRIKQASYTGSEGYDAIVMRSGSTLAVNNVQIKNNSIEYDEETTTTSYSATAAAVGFTEASVNTTFSGCLVSYNTIINSPLIAIVMGFGNGTFKHAVIGPNTIVNPGQTKNGAASTYRAGVWLGANNYSGSLTINRQTFIDTFVTTRMVYGIFSAPGVTTATLPCTWEFDVKLEGTTTTSFSQPVANVNSSLTPLVNGTMNAGFSIAPTHTYKAGSVIRDTLLNIEYKTPTDTSSWTQYTYTASIPGNVPARGSIAWNTVPVAAGTIGWVYTTASGWKTWGTITA